MSIEANVGGGNLYIASVDGSLSKRLTLLPEFILRLVIICTKQEAFL